MSRDDPRNSLGAVKMTDYTALTPENLRRILDYNPETGALHWKPRAKEEFKSNHAYKTWLARFCGKPALTFKRKADGYFCGCIFAKHMFAHRVAWAIFYGEWPECVDHINRDGSDNRIANLKNVSHSENMKNIRKKSNNTSGTVGVYYDKRSNVWAARITNNGKRMHLGQSKNIEGAIELRTKAALKFNNRNGDFPESTNVSN